jgi:hypothetical protein
MSVTSDSKRMGILLVLTELIHLSGISQLSPSSAATMVINVTTARTLPSSPGEQSPRPRRPVLEPSCDCPSGMSVELPTSHVVYAPPIFIPEYKV